MDAHVGDRQEEERVSQYQGDGAYGEQRSTMAREQ